MLGSCGKDYTIAADSDRLREETQESPHIQRERRVEGGGGERLPIVAVAHTPHVLSEWDIAARDDRSKLLLY